MRRTRLFAALLVGALVAVGVVLTVVDRVGTAPRDLGLALVSGGIVGGSLVAVESLLVGAAERQGRHESLLAQLMVTGDLSGIDLSGEDLDGLYLAGRAFVAAQFEGASLREAKLYFSDLRHANLRDAGLADADLGGSTVAYGDLTGADLRTANLDHVDFTAAKLRNADLSKASMVNVRLTTADLRDADLTGVVIEGSYLDGADFRGASVHKGRIEANQHDDTTKWPEGYTPAPSVKVEQPPFASMSLPEYLVWRKEQPGQLHERANR